MSASLTQMFAVEPEHDWRLHAACRFMDPGEFFSPDVAEAKPERDEREARAKAVCARCVVRDACLDYAIRAGERYGIWGGMTELERRAYARKLSTSAQRSTAS